MWFCRSQKLRVTRIWKINNKFSTYSPHLHLILNHNKKKKTSKRPWQRLFTKTKFKFDTFFFLKVLKNQIKIFLQGLSKFNSKVKHAKGFWLYLHCTFGDCHVEVTKDVIRVFAGSIMFKSMPHTDCLLPSEMDSALLCLQGRSSWYVEPRQILPAPLKRRIVVHVVNFTVSAKKER